ncbi:MAG TPA: phosphatidate cytidylyltransferase [Saprospiraceae bacterium]|nr:phosphatidate cytidylyltransferase [Saprospiraceae bacterium]
MNKELFIRSVTGIFIVAITLVAVVYSPYTFVGWLALITFFGILEFLNLEPLDFPSRIAYSFATIISAVIAITGFTLIRFQTPFLVPLIIPVIIPVFILLQLITSPYPAELVQRSKSFFTAVLYIGIPLLTGCIFLIGGYNFQFILVPIILIWTNDVMAYLIGSKWGTKKIMPLISPGKSLQGTVGGGIVTVLVSLLLLKIWPVFPLGYVLSLGIATPLFALGGDLWESSLKRNAGVKDSGQILPGHGGILDRYDSLLFVMPLAALAYFIFVL